MGIELLDFRAWLFWFIVIMIIVAIAEIKKK